MTISGSVRVAANGIAVPFLWLSALKKRFIYFWLCWIFLAACRLSLVAESGSYSLVGVHGLLTAVASLFAERGF